MHLSLEAGQGLPVIFLLFEWLEAIPSSLFPNVPFVSA